MNRRVVLLVAVLAWWPFGAIAADSPNQIDTAPRDPQVRALFREATAAYDAHEYERAIGLFKKAYELSKLPVILFDIGQTYRALGQCRGARESFEGFLAAATSDESLRARARARLAEFETCKQPATPAAAATLMPSAPPKQHGSLLVVPKSPSAAATPVLVGQSSTSSVPSRTSRSACLTATGATLALGLTSATFATTAWITAKDVEKRSVWDSETQRADARGHALEAASIGVLIGSGVTGAIALASCWMAWRHRSGLSGSSESFR